MGGCWVGWAEGPLIVKWPAKMTAAEVARVSCAIPAIARLGAFATMMVRHPISMRLPNKRSLGYSCSGWS